MSGSTKPKQSPTVDSNVGNGKFAKTSSLSTPGSSATGLTCRKNILVLATTRHWDKGELDRYMIALYRYQTEGRVAYRRIMGMHGGGGGWKGGDVPNVKDRNGQQLTYEGLLLAKATADAKQGHYDTSTSFTWPDISPNNAVPEKQEFLQSPYT